MSKQIFQERKAQYLRENDFLAALEVPLKKRMDLPSTFAIPAPALRKKIVPKPVVQERGFAPEPTVEDEDYQQILQTIYEYGRVMERHPSMYRGKVEDDVRDLFLAHLEPQFEGSTTAETFNMGGKTDILMNYQGANAFVAECKFWKGSKALLGTVGKPG
jgi:hypothetical protein